MNDSNLRELKGIIEGVQALMIAYVTDGQTSAQPADYLELRGQLHVDLEELGYANPNQHTSLETFSSFCKLKEMNDYASRRTYVRELYQPLLDRLVFQADQKVVEHVEPTGWDRVDRAVGKKIFVIHGHDSGTKETVARFLEKIGLQPIILHEQPSQGNTIIEKFEEHSDVAYAVALLTPDDICAPAGDSGNAKSRARQNVIFEFGYFIGKIGRNRVVGLTKGDLELPSDYSGVIYIPIDELGAWKLTLIGELKSAGLEVDANTAI